MHVVVMGASGSGKTTVALLLAKRAGLRYAEADEFHSPANIAKMSAGSPLTDADRLPWLHRLANWISDHESHGTATVLACSALRRHYRDILAAAAPEVRFVHLAGSRTLLASRLKHRTDHFMPTALLDSQLETLEDLDPDEAGCVLDIAASPEELANAALDYLGLTRGAAPPRDD